MTQVICFGLAYKKSLKDFVFQLCFEQLCYVLFCFDTQGILSSIKSFTACVGDDGCGLHIISRMMNSFIHPVSRVVPGEFNQFQGQCRANCARFIFYFNRFQGWCRANSTSFKGSAGRIVRILFFISPSTGRILKEAGWSSLN